MNDGIDVGRKMWQDPLEPAFLEFISQNPDEHRAQIWTGFIAAVAETLSAEYGVKAAPMMLRRLADEIERNSN